MKGFKRCGSEGTKDYTSKYIEKNKIWKSFYIKKRNKNLFFRYSKCLGIRRQQHPFRNNIFFITNNFFKKKIEPPKILGACNMLLHIFVNGQACSQSFNIFNFDIPSILWISKADGHGLFNHSVIVGGFLTWIKWRGMIVSGCMMSIPFNKFWIRWRRMIVRSGCMLSIPFNKIGVEKDHNVFYKNFVTLCPQQIGVVDSY